VQDKRSRMAILEEVVAEMFRQEHGALEVEPESSAENDERNSVNSLPYRELEYEQVVDEGIAGIEYGDSSNPVRGTLYTLYEDEDEDHDEFDDLTVPYEGSDEDDDGGCFSDVDPRYIDSGWDAECLQNAEDIDFEFVYALHTFVATVEGQANATKGDTMVLLDDSNSYWWLVRVVKDSSIGERSI